MTMGSGNSKTKAPVSSSTTPSSSSSSPPQATVRPSPAPVADPSQPTPSKSTLADSAPVQPTQETKQQAHSSPSPHPPPQSGKSTPPSSKAQSQKDGTVTQASAGPPSEEKVEVSQKGEGDSHQSGKCTNSVSTNDTMTVSSSPALTPSVDGGDEMSVPNASTMAGKPHLSGEPSQKDDSSKSKMATAAAENMGTLAPVPEKQRLFDTALRATNQLVKAAGLLNAAHGEVSKLSLKRALPPHIRVTDLMAKLSNLQVLDISGNQLGPQGVRALCLALPPSSPLLSLCIADNKTDTDTAEDVGHLLSRGPPLEYLDVSGNYLGKDFFSRTAGAALKTNTSLQTLRAQSIGMVDAKVLLDGLTHNSSLVELDLSNNQLTDRKALGVAMATVLKRADCSLQSLSLGGCNMSEAGLTELREGVASNSSLLALNLRNNEFGRLQLVLDLVATAACHAGLRNLCLNDSRITDSSLQELPKPSSDAPSQLQCLGLNSAGISDEFFSRLDATFKGRLPQLLDVDISNNSKLTSAAVDSLRSLTADGAGGSSIVKLTLAMNEMTGLAAVLTSDTFPCLAYLNLRKARLSPDEFVSLAGVISPAGPPLTTLVLDGMKLSGKKGLPLLFGHCAESKLTALSLSGCSVTDADLSPLFESLGSGFKVSMLKVSENRLSDASVKALAESVQRSATHPLSVLDMGGNQISEVGAKDLCSVYNNKKHASSLHSLNLSNNKIGKEGVQCLLSCMGGKRPLTSLYVSQQSATYLESDMEDIYSKLATVLGYTVKRTGETIEKGCSNLPSLPDGLAIIMRGLGGHSGELGSMLDCPAIMTDCSGKFLPALSLQDVMDVCASMQGQKGGTCVLSAEDWNHVTGANRDSSIPSWLQLADSRDKAVYLSNLPGNCTSQRLEALFENEADCNMEEIYLVKDPVTKNNAGTAWVLFKDQASVQRAVEFYNTGEALVFGTAFTVSTLRVTVQDTAAGQSSDKARQDVLARQKARAAEERAHRQLVQQNTEESWKRHAYRLAHPAYADGRIW